MNDRRFAAVMVAPATFVMLGIAGYPLFAAAWMSFHRWILVFHEYQFIGFENYGFLVRDPRFVRAALHTLYFTAVAVSLELLIAVPLAVALSSALPARGAVRAFVLLPWAVPTVVSGKIWAYFFDADSGAIRAVSGGAVDWLGTPGYAMHAAIVADVWKTVPFVALLVLAGLQTISPDLYEAARVDGASSWRLFRSITLPLLRPAIRVAVLFRVLDALRVFDAIYVLTGGGPANTTESLSIYGYKTLMRAGDFGYGSTLSVATFAIVAACAGGFLVVFRERRA